MQDKKKITRKTTYKTKGLVEKTCIDVMVVQGQCSHPPSRSSYAWTGTERNRHQYDRSRNGPVTGRAQRDLQREFNWRASSLSKPTSTNFTPVDAAFR